MTTLTKTITAAIVALVTVGGVAFIGRDRRRPERFAPVAGIAGDGYQCKAPAPISAASTWPVPRDAIHVGDEIYTKVLRPGAGARRPKLGSGQVVVLCVTYYNRDGSVQDHDPAAVIELDPGSSRWCTVAAMMTEGEIRRVWIRDHETPGGTMIADFEMEPWPKEALSPSDLRRKKT